MNIMQAKCRRTNSQIGTDLFDLTRKMIGWPGPSLKP